MGRVIFSLLSAACLMASPLAVKAVLAADPLPVNTVSPAEAEQIKQEVRDRLRQERELRAEIRDRMMRLPPQEREVLWQELNPQVNPRRGPPPGFGPATGAGPSGFGQGFEGRAPATPRR